MPKPMWDLRYYDTAQKRAGSFFLSKIKNNQIYYNLRADSMRWDTAKKNWHVDECGRTY